MVPEQSAPSATGQAQPDGGHNSRERSGGLRLDPLTMSILVLLLCTGARPEGHQIAVPARVPEVETVRIRNLNDPQCQK